MNTSLVFCVLALSSSWTPPAAPDIDPSAIFARTEPIGLFDQVTAPGFELPVMTKSRDVLSAYNAANFGPPDAIRGARHLPSLLRAQRDAIIRAQSPAVQLADGMREDVPRPRSPQQTFLQPSNPTFVAPTQQSQSSPTSSAPYEEPVSPSIQNVQPFTQPVTPFMTVPPPGGVSTWGTNGPQPYRLGYSLWGDLGWLPSRPTSLPNGSKFEVFEANFGLNHTIPTWWSPWLFSLEHQFGYRSWSGPKSTNPTFVGATQTLTTPNRVDLPASVYHLGWDMRLETPLNSQFAPFSMMLAFNPTINSDFNQSLSRNAYNFDGRGLLIWQADPHLQFAIGAQFWDRVHDRVIPYAGFTWLPDDRWEFRIMWPQSRIQYYCGNYMGEDVWLYLNGEYHIESYQIGSSTFVVDTPPPLQKGHVIGRTDQVELEDYRIVMGLRKQSPIASGFIEGGWVFGRRVDQRLGPDFHINSGFIGRMGFRF